MFPGNSSGEATCPHCRRVVIGYTYAFFATLKFVSELQDKVSQLEAKVNRMNKNIALTKADSEAATRRVDEWCRWATAAKASLQAMPPSSMPSVHVVVGPHPESETTARRSRSRSRIVGEYNG